MGDKRCSRICVDCGGLFEGWSNSLRCPECVGKRRKENQQRAMEWYKERAAKQQIEKPAENKPIEKKPNTDQCKGCIYWRCIRDSGSTGAPRACHYMLDTGKRRERDGDTCYSRTIKAKRKKKEWPVYN